MFIMIAARRVIERKHIIISHLFDYFFRKTPQIARSAIVIGCPTRDSGVSFVSFSTDALVCVCMFVGNHFNFHKLAYIHAASSTLKQTSSTIRIEANVSVSHGCSRSCVCASECLLDAVSLWLCHTAAVAAVVVLYWTVCVFLFICVLFIFSNRHLFSVDIKRFHCMVWFFVGSTPSSPIRLDVHSSNEFSALSHQLHDVNAAVTVLFSRSLTLCELLINWLHIRTKIYLIWLPSKGANVSTKWI